MEAYENELNQLNEINYSDFDFNEYSDIYENHPCTYSTDRMDDLIFESKSSI
jgi:hypothetical protein